MGFIGNEDVAFGGFRLSVRHRTLSDPQGGVSLKSRAFDVLLTLIECRARVVSKDELMRRVWGDLVVEENNLHVQVAAVRRALGGGARYIQTIPGHGYRFVGPLKEADEPPTSNLPARMTPMVGRSQELAAVADLLDHARLVTLTGPSGVGKTKLAVEAARGLRERFPAGCWWAALGSVTDARLALRAVAASLRTDEIQGKPLIDGLAEVLGRGRVLLVLDGCERVAPAVAALIGQLLGRCVGLKVLCTSHVRLGVEGERVRRIAPLVPAALAPGVTALRPDTGRSFARPVWDGDVRGPATDEDAEGAPGPRRGLARPAPAVDLAEALARTQRRLPG